MTPAATAGTSPNWCDSPTTVAQALPVLGLSADDQQAAKTLTDQIAKAALEPEPDHSRLKVLGGRLYPILEDTADNALTSALLRVWHP